MPRFIPLLAGCCAAVLTLAGCSSDEPAPNYSSVTPTPSASSGTPATSPTSSPTDIPATGPNVSPGEVAPTPAAAPNTAEGAQAFATYYFRMLDWSYAANDAGLMNRFFAADCSNCSKLSDNLSATFERGTVTGTRITIKQIALVDNDKRGGAQYAVDGVVDISKGALMESGSTTPIPAEPGVTITLWVAYSVDHWQVVAQAQAT